MVNYGRIYKIRVSRRLENMAVTKGRWVGGMTFHVRTPSNHDVYMDASPEVGGNDGAARPFELLAVALIGCTGMDVVSILKKMKVENYSLEFECEFEKAPEHPKYLTKAHLKYIFTGKDLPRDKIEKAVKLSQERYCSVSETLRGKAELTYEIIIKEE
jgi:putative redox protein